MWGTRRHAWPVCRAVQEMEKVLVVMQALRTAQPVAETLLASHRGDVAAAISAALDGHHG